MPRRPIRSLGLGVVLFSIFAAIGIQATSAAGQSTSVTVNGSTTDQTIAGFGSSEAFYQADILMDEPSATQATILNLLYSTKTGAGLSILRNQIGGTPAYGTIEPTSPASPSSPPTYSPLGNDIGQEWLAATIKKKYKVDQFIGDAWSAPPFMKTNDSDVNGGTLCGAPGTSCATGDWRQAYANYLVQYAKDYAADGLPLEYIGFENEASYAPDYSSMIMSPSQTADFADVLGPTLADSGLSTRIECCDTIGWDHAPSYASAIESDPEASSWVSVFTSHGYTGEPNSLLSGWNKPVWESEWSTADSFDPAWDDGTDASGFTWAQNIYTGLTSANLSAFNYWWGVDFEDSQNGGLINVSHSTITTSARLWAFANYSRFIRPGAVRVAANSSSSALEVTAFKNTNKKVAIVVLNTSTSPVTTSFSLAGAGMPVKGKVTPYLTDGSSDTAAQAKLKISQGSFTATIQPRSLVTYQGKG